MASMAKTDEEVKAALTVVPTAPAPLVHRPAEQEPMGYQGASTGVLTSEEANGLMASFAEDEYDIKPTEHGEVFVSQVHVRRRLNQTIGPLQWAMVPVAQDGKLFFKEGDKDSGQSVLMRGRLYVRDHFVSEAIGEQLLAFSRMTYASACEAAKSDALVRCCKDLSVGWECWDKRWCDRWRQKFAMRVAIKRKQEVQYVWRRKDAPPLRGEMAMGKAGKVEAEHDEGPADLISESQSSDLWALITKTFPRKKAEETAREILKRHGFDSFKNVTKSKLPAIIAEIKATGEGA